MNRIKQLRKEKDITQKELAKLLGLEDSAISKLEVGRVPLRDEYIIKLADFFGVSTDYLLGRTNQRNYINKDKGIFISLDNAEDVEKEDIETLKDMFYVFINSKKKKK